MLTCYGKNQSEDGAAPLSCEPLWLDRGCWNIKDCKYQRIISEVSPAEDVLRVFCSRTDLCTASCACRHVLDDPSGRSSEDDGERLQRGCCGEDDTVLNVCSSECRSVSRVSLKSLLLLSLRELKGKLNIYFSFVWIPNQIKMKTKAFQFVQIEAVKQESISQSRCVTAGCNYVRCELISLQSAAEIMCSTCSHADLKSDRECDGRLIQTGTIGMISPN